MAAANKTADKPTEETVEKPVKKAAPVVTIAGQKFTLKIHPETLVRRFGFMREVRKAPEIESFFLIAEEILPEEALAVLDDMDIEDAAAELDPVFAEMNLGN